jgi:3-methyladenine DNA glycosylase AlkD
LRQIGKRSWTLHAPAVRLAQDLKQMQSPAARWIGADAVRELKGETARRMLDRRTKKI